MSADIMITKELKEFISAHMSDDIVKLLISSSLYPEIDIRLAVSIIEARKKLSLKVPEWASNQNLVFGESVTLEQSSSYQTATYKQSFCKNGYIADITGGLGIDSYYLAKSNKRVLYIERNRDLFNNTIHNFRELAANNIECINEEADLSNFKTLLGETLDRWQIEKFDMLYIDPSRRKQGGKRVSLIDEYEPQICTIKEELFKYSDKILVKVSPMADIKSLKDALKEVVRIDIVAVDNECKELLVLLEKNTNTDYPDLLINAVQIKENILDSKIITFTPSIESNSSVQYRNPDNGVYLYEPNVSLLKAGAFKYISELKNVYKLHKNTHLYCSKEYFADFPGRIFKIKEVADFNKNTIRNLHKTYPKANISSRNFPLNPVALRERLKIDEGGDITIFGCTISTGVKSLIICKSAI